MCVEALGGGWLWTVFCGWTGQRKIGSGSGGLSQGIYEREQWFFWRCGCAEGGRLGWGGVGWGGVGI